MERLQSRFLIKPYFLNKSYFKDYVSDKNNLDYDEFIMKFSYLFDEINLSNKYIEQLLKNNIEYRYCSNFYDPFTNQIVPLPIKIINLLTHSNGLCSGNSKNEALVQGICEIFERYCYKQLLLSEKSFPTINVDNINEF